VGLVAAPSYPEPQAYVAKILGILGILGDADDINGTTLEGRLLE
jgi:hypothetical protein